MRVTVRFFAILRDRAAMDELILNLPPGSVVSAALESIGSKLPSICTLLPRAAVAINREYASRDTTLNDGDELALIPPVSGG